MLHPHTPLTGRTALFVEVDAGFDDVRARVHCTGCPGEQG